MHSPTRLRVEADLKNLAPIRKFVETTARNFCSSPQVASDMVIAVNEAVTNIIIHGYKNQPKIIEIEMEKDKERIVVYIRDRAPGFDPTIIPTPDLALPLEKRPMGRLGIPIMDLLTDDLYYRHTLKGENELVLIKNNISQFKKHQKIHYQEVKNGKEKTNSKTPNN